MNTKTKIRLQLSAISARAENFERFTNDPCPAARYGIEFNDIVDIARESPYLGLTIPQDLVDEAKRLYGHLPEFFCNIEGVWSFNEKIRENWPYDLIDRNLDVYDSYLQRCGVFERRLHKFISEEDVRNVINPVVERGRVISSPSIYREEQEFERRKLEEERGDQVGIRKDEPTLVGSVCGSIARFFGFKGEGK